jgi:hypothetical protein
VTVAQARERLRRGCKSPADVDRQIVDQQRWVAQMRERWRADDAQRLREDDTTRVAMATMAKVIRRAHRDGDRLKIPRSRQLAYLQTYTRGLIEETATLKPEVIADRAAAYLWAAEHGVRIEEVRTYHDHGSALPRRGVVQVPPLRTLWTMATCWHELGHLANRCTHRRVSDGQGGTLCVTCEIAAWRFATELATYWTADSHANMAAALQTYRPYATAAQAAAIDELTLRLTLRRLQAARLKG